jgi:hypothetical protein
MIVRWREDSQRRIANGYSTATRHRVLGIRVANRVETTPPLAIGDRIIIMTDRAWDRDIRRVWRVHERDLERVLRSQAAGSGT